MESKTIYSKKGKRGGGDRVRKSGRGGGHAVFMCVAWVRG